jgi:hypothetical protein
MKAFFAFASIVVAASAACSGPSQPGDSDDAGPSPDAAGDATSPSDAAPPTDGSVSTDAAHPADAASTAACVPSPGAMTLTSECDQVQLAILQNGSGTPTVAIQGRVNVGSPTTPPCTAVDSIDVVSGGATIATIPGTLADTPSEGATYPLASGPATSALVALCASDSGRFDGVGLVVHGHVDGGTFTATCGNNTPDVGWPPRVVLTCHTGLAAIPFATDGVVMSTTFMGMTVTSDQLFALVPQPPVLMTADSTVHLIPGVSSFGGGQPIAPSDTTGWTGATSTMMLQDGGSGSNLTMFNDMDVLGPQLCPPGCTNPPCGVSTPPVFIARVTGTADTGAFESELYVPVCTSQP